MEYRYYIYRQNLAITPFDKYDLTNYEYVCEITNNGQWGLNIERNADWFTVIRQEFNGDISVSGADYNVLIAIEGDTRQYAIVIHRKCKGKVYSEYTEFWKGYFSYFDFKVDMDRCLISFQPMVWDAYSPVFDQIEIERNVLTADVNNPVLMDTVEWAFEDMPYSYTNLGPPAYRLYSEHPDYPGSKYYFYSQVCTWTGETDGTDLITENYEVYRRDVGFSNSDIVGPPGTNWISLSEETMPGIWKWVRPYLNLTAGTATFHNEAGAGPNFTRTMTNLLGDTVTLRGCLLLQSILEFYADLCGLTYTSDFLNDDPCPMGGATLNLTMLDQISNIRDVSDVAIKGMMKLKDLLTWIRDTFNAYWYVDSNGDFRIEHRRYFDYGLSYTYSHVIELDLAINYPTEVLNMRRYEWERPTIARYEKLEFPYNYLFDWTEAKIEYPQYSILGNVTKTRTSDWGTDIFSMYEQRDDLPDKGWALLDIFIYSSQYKVRPTVGAVTGNTYPNARFSQGNLLRDLWTFGRLLPTGYVNNTLTTFDSIDKLRQQEQLTFPQCCTEIDYNGIFRTPLGDGIIDKAEYEAKTGNLKVNLIYE